MRDIRAPMGYQVSSREDLVTLHADNKGADKPSYLRRLRNVFCVSSLEGTLAKLAAWTIPLY